MSTKEIRDNQYFEYELARAIGTERRDAGEDLRLDELVAIHNLTPGLAALLRAVTHNWKHGGLGDHTDFLAAVTAISENDDFCAASRAMACEHASSAFTGDQRHVRLEWTIRAWNFVPELGPNDQMLLHASCVFGLMDEGLAPVNETLVDTLLAFMLNFRAYNAPNRVRKHTDRRIQNADDQDAARRAALSWFDRLLTAADDGQPCAFNRYWLGRARTDRRDLYIALSDD